MLSLRPFAIAAAALLVVGVATSDSQAQIRVMPNSQSLVNPYYRVAPGLPLNQAAYNIRTLGRAYSNVPPWLYGYNPYPPVIVTPYATPVYSYYPNYTYPTMPVLPYNYYGVNPYSRYAPIYP